MKILLVHNRFRFSDPVSWLSLLIRIVTCSKWNHIAIEHQGFVTEAIGEGVIETPFGEWQSVSDRIVLPLGVEATPDMLMRLELAFGVGYGFFDLLQIFKHIRRTKWHGESHTWDGSTKLIKGYTCSELAATVLGLENPHLFMPCDFEHLGLVKGEVFETKKRKIEVAVLTT